MSNTKITESFATIPKLSDYGINFNEGFSGQKLMEYMNAVQRWASTFGFQLTQLLEEIKDLDPHPVSYYQGQRDILKQVLGVK